MSFPSSIEVDGFPITLVFSKDGRAFFSERVTGNLWEVLGEEKFQLIKHFPVVPITGHHETGLLGIALGPDFEKNGFVYCFYTYGEDEYAMKNKVVRIKIKDGAEKVILDGIPAGRIHNGGIIAFGPGGKLYIGVGIDNSNMEKSQAVKFLGGKVLRINADGTIPADNPIKDSPVYSWGHRNIFGLAFHPKTGKLYISEEGPDENDEINIIEAGGNYGWPEVTGKAERKEYIDPIISYTPTITPTQNCFFRDNLYFGSFNEGSVHKLKLDENDPTKVISDKIVYKGRPFGVVGVFVSREEIFYVATKNQIIEIEI